MNKPTSLIAARSVLVVALACMSDRVCGDVTVWTNGLGQGGATVRVSERGESTTETFIGLGTGTSQNVSLGNAGVTFAWGPGWQVDINAHACGPGTSYGDGGVATHCVSTFVELVGALELGGMSGEVFNLTGVIGIALTDPANVFQVHYTLLATDADVIPEGFLGRAEDLVQAGVISADDVIFQSNNLILREEPIDLGQILNEENLTLLVWTHGSFIVPTLSQWGILIMALSLLATATVILRRRRVNKPTPNI